MPDAQPAVGRRDRNKRDKLDRIMSAASLLFERDGVDAVTTHQVAAEAGIGAGTLFLYAKNKGELLLLVQTARYAAALEEGRVASEATSGALPGVVEIVRAVVLCNRSRIDNGRAYLREMLFGDAHEPHHASALQVVATMERLLAVALERDAAIHDPVTMAESLSAVIFVTLAADENSTMTPGEIVGEIERKVSVLIPASSSCGDNAISTASDTDASTADG